MRAAEGWFTGPIARMSGATRVRLFTVLLGLSACGVLFTSVRTAPDAVSTLAVPAIALFLMFALSEGFVIHLQHGRDAHSFSLSEVPLVLGLAGTPGPLLVAARVLGSLIALTTWRRQRGAKLVFNVVHETLEVCVALAVHRLILGDASALSPRGWAAAFIATSAVHLYGNVAVTTVIGLAEGRIEAKGYVENLGPGGASTAVNTCLALVAAIALASDWRVVVLLAATLGMLSIGYRTYTSLRQENELLHLLSGFTGRVNRTLELEAVMRSTLEEARSLLRAEQAELVLLPGRDAPAQHGRLHGEEAFSVVQPDHAVPTGSWWSEASQGDLVLGDNGLAAPLHLDDDVVGVLLVTHRLGDVSTFDNLDLELLRALATHASVAIHNARLLATEHLSLHDPLTGLPNRRLFARSVDAALSLDTTSVVMLMDLDRFKEVNDTLGHTTGDMLLLEIGRRLTESVPEGATVARLGGDEFAVLLPDTLLDDAKVAARAFLTALAAPYMLFEITLEVEASVGLAVWPAHGRDAGELLQRADVAMYDAKARRTGVEVYSPGIDRSSLRRLSLIGELRRAIDAGAVEVHYQPKVELATGRAVGVEALARWQHPSLGAVPPDEFVSVAEQTGLIRPLTELVLVAALVQCARWRREGRRLRVAVNLSTRSLMDLELPELVERLLERAGVPATDLILEITESNVLGEHGRAADIIDRLRLLGVELSIDDFGTGHSSLTYLKHLPVSEVKIDRSFVSNMVNDSSDAAIVASTIGLGHRLGLRVVAEGVEDADTVAALESLGCDQVQGYFHSRPLPAAALEEWLDEREGASALVAAAAAR